VNVWCALSCSEVWDPFSLRSKQWQRWPTWTCYSFICYPSWKIISHMQCSFILSKNFLSFFLALDEFCGLCSHLILHCLISTCGDMLRT
jgi:hypothetical protein